MLQPGKQNKQQNLFQSLLLQIASKSGIITNVDFTAADTFMGSAKDLCKNTETSWLSWMFLVTFILVKYFWETWRDDRI